MHPFVIIRTSTVAYPHVFVTHARPCEDRAASSVLELIGHTPLVRLRRFERETPGVELYAKAEWQNPGGQ